MELFGRLRRASRVGVRSPAEGGRVRISAPSASKSVSQSRQFTLPSLTSLAGLVHWGGHRRNTSLGPDSKKHFTVVLSAVDEGGRDISLDVRMSHTFKTQHVLIWDEPISIGGMVLPPGSCNLYSFPAFISREPGQEGDQCVPTGKQLELLCRLVLAAVSLQDGRVWCSCVDASGAYPVHALLIANTSPSIALALIILRQLPHLLLQQHDAGARCLLLRLLRAPPCKALEKRREETDCRHCRRPVRRPFQGRARPTHPRRQ